MSNKLNNTTPLISIITSTYNAEGLLDKTAYSLRNQDFKDFEWIVIDGKSTDNTLDIIKENQDIITFWLSEKDTGIYDAWNKSLKYIKGEWVIFLGAGDQLYSKNTFLEISKYLENNNHKNLIYGRTQLVSEDNNSEYRLWGRPWELLKDKYEMIRPALPPHPSSFINISIFKEKKYRFPKELKISGDSHLLLTLVEEASPLFVPLTVDIMPSGGVSTLPENQLKLLKELKWMSKEFSFEIPLRKYIIGVFKVIVLMFLGAILSQKNILFLLKFIKKTT